MKKSLQLSETSGRKSPWEAASFLGAHTDPGGTCSDGHQSHLLKAPERGGAAQAALHRVLCEMQRGQPKAKGRRGSWWQSDEDSHLCP